MKKPDPRSVLKTLPAEFQRELYEYVRGHSIDHTRAWLKERGVEIGVKAICRFYHWYPLTVNPLTAKELQDLLEQSATGESKLQATEREIGLTSRQFFEALAIQQLDSKLFVRLQRMRQREQRAALSPARPGPSASRPPAPAPDPWETRLRYQRDTCAHLLDWLDDERARAIATCPAPREEKIESLRQLIFE